MPFPHLAVALAVACNPRPSSAPEPIPWLPSFASNSSYDPTWYRAAIDSLSRHDPKAEARLAIQRGDCRVLAIIGFAPEPPGIDISLSQYRFGYYFFQGTSDNMHGGDQLAYTKAAYAFAEKYNKLVLAEAKRTQ